MTVPCRAFWNGKHKSYDFVFLSAVLLYDCWQQIQLLLTVHGRDTQLCFPLLRVGLCLLSFTTVWEKLERSSWNIVGSNAADKGPAQSSLLKTICHFTVFFITSNLSSHSLFSVTYWGLVVSICKLHFCQMQREVIIAVLVALGWPLEMCFVKADKRFRRLGFHWGCLLRGIFSWLDPCCRLDSRLIVHADTVRQSVESVLSGLSEFVRHGFHCVGSTSPGLCPVYLNRVENRLIGYCTSGLLSKEDVVIASCFIAAFCRLSRHRHNSVTIMCCVCLCLTAISSLAQTFLYGSITNLASSQINHASIPNSN